MEYVALYRKFRPTTFSDMVGQENIVKILKHQIINNQVGHAYLFSGGRGTGKTSTAKIFARAINCLNPKDGEPCNECEICKGILNSSLVDVQEIDAASNNSVDNIRSIREDVIFAPNMAKYKIYIIDEVHMLSTGAFNALLKTLEEPPKHVIFILATTEPHKIPVTILSRCQRFDFKRISVSDISKRLAYICDKSDVKYNENALNIIANSAEGALRDGISILDQIISSGITEITEENVKETLGISSTKTVASVISSILNNDTKSALNNINELVNSGKDIKYFIWQVITFARDALIYKVTGDTSLLTNFSAAPDIREISKASNEELTTIINEFSELENKIKWATFPNISLETAVIKLCNPVSTASPVKQVSAHKEEIKVEKTKAPQPATPKAPKPKFNNWADVMDSLKNTGKMTLYGALIDTTANLLDNTLTINFPKERTFGKSIIEKAENLDLLKGILKENTGNEYIVKCAIESDETVPNTSNETENMLKNSGINVTIS